MLYVNGVTPPVAAATICPSLPAQPGSVVVAVVVGPEEITI